MRIAASIFLIAGLAYLGWDIALSFSGGVRVATWLMGLFALALLYQAYELFLSKPHARRNGIVSSSILAIGFGAIACLLIAPLFPEPMSGLAEIWPTLIAIVLVSATFAAAAVLLVLSKRAAL